MPIRLALLLATMLAACLFSSDTKGLPCTQNDHCQAGQVCSQGTCKSGDQAGDETTSDGGGSETTGTGESTGGG